MSQVTRLSNLRCVQSHLLTTVTECKTSLKELAQEQLTRVVFQSAL